MKITILAVFMATLLIASYMKFVDLDIKYIVIMTLILIILTYENNMIEGY